MKKIIITTVMIITTSLTLMRDTRAAPVETFGAVNQDLSIVVHALDDRSYIIHVPGDFQDLQDAINQITDGGIIESADGIYPSPSGGLRINNVYQGFTIRAAPYATGMVLLGAPVKGRIDTTKQYTIYLPVVVGFSDFTLKEMFAQHGIRFGFAVDSSSFRNPVTRQLIVDHAAVVTTEDALKMQPTRPEQGVFDFSEADLIMQYSKELGIPVHGHTASWSLQNPDWLVNGSFSDNELADILENHVSTLAQRYEGQLISLDAANEAYVGGLNCGPWCALGNNYIQISFESAQNSASYPIVYNSVYPNEDECSQALNLLDQGLVDGIGIQLHLSSGGWEAKLARMDAFLDQIRQHGGWARFSEVGVLADEQTQATVYAAITALAVKHIDIIKDFVVWGVTDEGAWRGPVTLFDCDGQPKPAYFAVVEELKR